MVPQVAGALIGGVTGLLGGLFSAAAQRREKRRQRDFDALQKSFETQESAAQQMGKNQMSSFESMMSAYKGIL